MHQSFSEILHNQQEEKAFLIDKEIIINLKISCLFTNRVCIMYFKFVDKSQIAELQYSYIFRRAKNENGAINSWGDWSPPALWFLFINQFHGAPLINSLS